MNVSVFASLLMLASLATDLRGQLVLAGEIAPGDDIPKQWVISVFQPDGTVQCQNTPGIPLETMARTLSSNGARVIDMRKVPLPMAVIAECNTPTGMVNKFTLLVTGSTVINPIGGNPTGYSFWPGDETTLLVSTRDGAVRCGNGGDPIPVTTARLTGAGITVTEPLVIKAGLDPDRTGRCGVPIGDTHVFRIPAVQLVAALKLKFSQVATRLPPQCVGIALPPPGSSDSSRVSLPQARALIIPQLDGTPSNMRGKPIAVSIFTNSAGGVDSLATAPVLTGKFATMVEKTMKGYQFVPAIFDGCFIPMRYQITLTF